MKASPFIVSGIWVVTILGHALMFYSFYEFFNSFMPEWVALVGIDEDIPSEEQQSKEGENSSKWTDIKRHWGRYLIDDSNPHNASWWKWAFRDNKMSQAKSSWFRQVEVDYNNNENETRDSESEGKKSLNKTCKHFYEYEEKISVWPDYLKNEKDAIIHDIWTFCSIGGEGLITLTKDSFKKHSSEQASKVTSEAGSGSDSTTSSEIDETKLVSTKEISNLWWWAIREKEFNKGKITGTDNLKGLKEKKKRTLLGECSDYYNKRYYRYLPTDSSAMINDTNVHLLCGTGIPIVPYSATQG